MSASPLPRVVTAPRTPPSLSATYPPPAAAPRPMTCSPRLIRPIDRIGRGGVTPTVRAETARPAKDVPTTATPPPSRSHTRPARLRSSAATRSRLVVFAEQPDRLLCDPANALWVYCSYDFKFVYPDLKSRTQAERLIEHAMEYAESQYRRSVHTFRHLPEHLRREHVLRDVPSALVSPGHGTARVTGPQERRRDVAASAERPIRADSLSVVGKTPRSGSTPRAELTLPRSPSVEAVGRSPTETRRRGSESKASDALYATLLRDWPALSETADNVRGGAAVTSSLVGLASLRYSAFSTAASTVAGSVSVWNPSSTLPARSRVHLKVKLVVDIVASRKSLREVPTQSKPYRLGQHLYHYVEQRYGDTVMHMCVGLSDAKVRLTCRDLLFPFKRLPVGTMVTTEEEAARVVCTSTAPTLRGDVGDDGDGGVAPASFVAPHLRLPPVTPDLIDQRRMLICFSANTRTTGHPETHSRNV